jgi:hypothetical protein
LIEVVLASLTIIGWGSLHCAAGEESAHVQVTTDKSSYRTAEPIVATVVNGLSVPIYALSGRTYCTIVTLQRSEDGQWSAEGRCLVSGPPGWVAIPAGGRTLVEVKPRLPADRPLAPGRHRAMLSFNVGSTTGASATVFSSEFVISDLGRGPLTTALTSCSPGHMA